MFGPLPFGQSLIARTLKRPRRLRAPRPVRNSRASSQSVAWACNLGKAPPGLPKVLNSGIVLSHKGCVLKAYSLIEAFWKLWPQGTRPARKRHGRVRRPATKLDVAGSGVLRVGSIRIDYHRIARAAQLSGLPKLPFHLHQQARGSWLLEDCNHLLIQVVTLVAAAARRFVYSCKMRQLSAALMNVFAVFGGIIVLLPHESLGFAQRSLRSNRERVGLNSPTIADERARLAAKRQVRPISSEGRRLLADMVQAGDCGDWQHIQQILSTHTGSEIQIFSCEIVLRINVWAAAARLPNSQKFSKLGNSARPNFLQCCAADLCQTRQLCCSTGDWAEADDNCNLNEPLALASIDAASVEGDIESAAHVLGEMTRTKVDIDVPHINAAMHTCAAAAGRAHNAAKFLFELMLQLELQPSIITFTSLMEAYRHANLPEVLATYAEMKQRELDMDFAFAETYLCAILQKPTDSQTRSVQALKAAISSRSKDRLAAARAALADFKAAGIRLTALSAQIDRALRQLDSAG